MQRTCGECAAVYDDARCTTICPHEPFLSEFDAAMKDCAMTLFGKKVRFHHQWKTGPDHMVQSVGFTGMITLADMDGEFSPTLFVVSVG